MPGFGDSAFIVLLALLLFGPKKLPVLARQLGKLMADFRRASNEFRTQMEEELRISEQADRQKQIAAIEAAAPPSPAIDTPVTPEPESGYMSHLPPPESTSEPEAAQELTPDSPSEVPADAEPAPLPIATSGELNIMPPATGLPLSHSEPANTTTQSHESELETETLHG
jgi:sec-independent protein translocase protein TatB